ncbi:ribulose-phosphate 3-epimerase [Lachnospiraceae bacterium]|nr:ribulose-phosphate 3-epimerase [Lachnospiraceae bacterium]
MMNLAPSILAADFCELGKQIDIVEKAGVSCLHVDIMDGMFVPSISFGMPVLKCLKKRSKLFMDVHMMVDRPERYVEELIKLGADGVTIHVEACRCVSDTLAIIQDHGVRAGIALNPETPVREIIPYIDMADLILVMTVHPGFGGQSYLAGSIDRIKMVRDMINGQKRDIRLEIDGGIYLNNLKMNLEAGADVIVAGSAVFEGDIEKNIKSFMELLI